jgi:hypothetical protein
MKRQEPRCNVYSELWKLKSTVIEGKRESKTYNRGDPSECCLSVLGVLGGIGMSHDSARRPQCNYIIDCVEVDGRSHMTSHNVADSCNRQLPSRLVPSHASQCNCTPASALARLPVPSHARQCPPTPASALPHPPAPQKVRSTGVHVRRTRSRTANREPVCAESFCPTINPARVTQQAAESRIARHTLQRLSLMFQDTNVPSPSRSRLPPYQCSPRAPTALQSSAQPKIRLKTSTVVFPSVHDGQGAWIGPYGLAELFDAS